MRMEPVYAWPVVGTLAYRAVYGLLRATLVPVMRLQHLKRLQRGTFVFMEAYRGSASRETQP